MRKLIVSAAAAAIAVVALTSSEGWAAGSAPKPAAQSWTFNGVFGYFDEGQLRRGYDIYRNVCSGCHGLRLLAYRNLTALGFSEDEVKEIAAEYEVPDKPNEFGETIVDGERLMRPALPADRFVSPFANENAARAANDGSLPPDLSLIVKARKGGADYLYALLNGYREEVPQEMSALFPDGLPDGKYYNDYFAGHAIAMAPQLYDEMVEYTDGTPATADQHAKDITAFLTWAASPELAERKALGLKVMLFLVVLTAMLFALKRKIWSRIH